MGTNLKSFLLCAAIFLLAFSPAAFGDWDEGGEHKMHWPQLPDLDGDGAWDVQILNQPPYAYNQLADDWMCTESGYIDEIHLWVSWEYDANNPIQEVRVRIYDDLPVDDPCNFLGYSTPNNCISGQGDWVFKAADGDFTVRQYGQPAWQGWFDPYNGGGAPICRPNDHLICEQINITDIVNTLSTQEFADPVNQTQGEIYWLSFRVIRDGDHLMGWKTSDDHFNDCAVWNKPIGAGQNQWTKLQDCLSGQDLDLAFVINNRDTTQEYREYGDAPEGALAYPSLGTSGSFPTCKNVAVASYVEHNNFGAYFGPTFDFEFEGNAGNCPLFNPNTYNMDECFQDGDAGLIMPESFTIQGAVGSEVVVPCPGFNGTALGQTCAVATWGTEIDIEVHNHMPGVPPSIGYVNVLIDWNQDGVWAGSSNCPGALVPEHVLVNWQIPNPYDGPLSGTMGAAPQTFQIGPNAGYVWARFSITEQPVPANWDGSGIFEDGESEDYLLLIDPSGGPLVKWSQPPVLHTEPDIYEGWDELSHDQLPRMVADDFLCDSNKPVTAIRWWGSFENWQENMLPPDLPRGFYLTIWNDIPATPGGEPLDPVQKWQQLPDLSDNGMDVEATEPFILADDFLCDVTGKLTDITVYASWMNDWLPGGMFGDPCAGDPAAVDFTLSIHADIPATGGPGGTPSMPGDVLWTRNIPAHSYNVSIFAHPITEWWMTPPNQAFFPGDTACFRYDFHVDLWDAFLQEGTTDNPIVYWLDVQARPVDPLTFFGWKTSETHWNDDAVWGDGLEPYLGPWYELIYPPTHPYEFQSIDLAFELITTPESQPTYSHPNEIIWENYCYTYDAKYYGQEYDPRTGVVDLSKFEFYQELYPGEYWQQPDDRGVYWLGIMALYDNDPCYAFGWETREHFYNDDAVRFVGMPQPGIQYPLTAFEPIEELGVSWDLSFELLSDPCELPELDFGDAPDGPYPTLLPPGASHVIVPQMTLGATIDPEPDGQPDASATGDDNNGLIPDDEDGVTFVSKLYPGNMARIDVVVSDPTGTALLQAWIDYDCSGTWDAAEAIAVDLPVFNGLNTLYPTVPSTTTPCTTFARFRLSTQSGLGPSGPAPDGEVEDYKVAIEELFCDFPPDDPNWIKWEQKPDESITGIDIRVDDGDGVWRIVADDFECNDPGPITDVHLWGSWLADQKGDIQKLTISIYDDIPAWVNPDGYSKPGNLLWMRDFLPGEFEEKFYNYVLPGEWWWDTFAGPLGLQFGDTEIWQYNICIDPTEAFIQEGTPSNPIVYWLAVNANVGLVIAGPEFGWKTSVDHWNDNAVVSHDGGMSWGMLGYPPNHELHDSGLTIDMAFAITGPNECYTGPDYLEWAAVGKPNTWCDPRQCHGDATNSKDGTPKGGYYYVQESDLNILIAGWKQVYLGNPVVQPWIAADFSHSMDGTPKGGYFRVQEIDLNILIAHWKKPDAQVPPDCLQ